MKKKIFLSGVNAKLALAAVALTSVMFTSCEKEEFNVAPVELDPASATVAITVYDLSDGSIINGASITENGAAITSNPFVIEAGSDGKIAATTRTFAATKDEYLSGEGQATVPALNKGQFALIPVSIFLLDPEMVKEVLNIIKDLASSGITMIIVTHEIDFARQVATKIIFMEKGNIVETGTSQEIFTQARQERTREFLFQIYRAPEYVI